MIAAAYGGFRAWPRSDFGAMFSLAVSLAGQVLLVFGVYGLFEYRDRTGAWMIIAAVEAVLAAALPNFIHRVLSSYAAGMSLAFAFVSFGQGVVAVAILAPAVAWLWLSELRPGRLHAIVAPVGYGLTLAFIHLETMNFHGQSVLWLVGPYTAAWGTPWVGEALVLGTLLCVVWRLSRQTGWMLPAVAVAAVVGAASFPATGIAAGLMIVLLGYANGKRVLTGLGIAALLYYVSSYYYLLDATLLAKSGVLAATGVALLAARALLLKVMPNA